jgi:hypothetical protein
MSKSNPIPSRQFVKKNFSTNLITSSQIPSKTVVPFQSEVYRSSRFIPELGLSDVDIHRISDLDHRIFHLRLGLKKLSNGPRRSLGQVARLERDLGELQAERAKYPEHIMEIIEFDGPPTRRWVAVN